MPDAAGDAKGNALAGVVARWSGNFLNWATATRIDVVRRCCMAATARPILRPARFCGLALLGTDAHAFAKYYRGTDIAKYTPFSVSDLSKGAPMLA